MVNKSKFKELVLRLIELEGGMARGLTRLAKLILFIDIESYKTIGKSITSDFYVRENRGPIPSHLYDVLEELEESGLVEQKIVEEGDDETGRISYKVYKLKKTASLEHQYLTDEEVKIIEEIYKKLKEFHGKTLSSKAHKLPAWKFTEKGDVIFIEELAVDDEDEYFYLQELVDEFEADEKDLLHFIEGGNSEL